MECSYFATDLLEILAKYVLLTVKRGLNKYMLWNVRTCHLLVRDIGKVRFADSKARA
jgi:hypothetical protein